MNPIIDLNYGQHLLYSYLCISIHGRRNKDITLEESTELIELVIDLTREELYEGEHTPDVQIMIQPDKSFEIFCDFWDENETYFVEFL